MDIVGRVAKLNSSFQARSSAQKVAFLINLLFSKVRYIDIMKKI